MKIVNKPLAKLVPYAKNSRTHSEVQVAQIAASIREFGFNNPVLIDPDGGVIAGHGRVLAAQSLGLETVPTITLAHLTEAQRRAYVIADNQIALNAGWDADLLRAELLSLGDDLDLDVLGFGDELENVLLEKQDGVNDPAEHWNDMPEFDQPDARAFRSIIVHFASQDAVDAFAKLTERTFTEKTKFMWYPQIEIETYADKRYVSVNPEAEPELEGETREPV